jgi:membrane protein required for colicin V production
VNTLDLFIIAVLAVATFAGFRTGFIVQVAAMLGAIAALAVAQADYADVRRLLQQFAPRSPWLTVISYVGTFLVIWGAIILLARRLRWMVRRLLLGGVDRLGGAILGFLQGALVVELAIYLARRVQSAALASQVKHSALAGVFERASPWIQGIFPHVTR